MTVKSKVIVLGTGPAGYTAGVYMGRANLNPIILSGDVEGGQLTKTTDVENYPGFPEGIQGFDLMMKMKSQAERFGAEIKRDTITGVDFSKRPFILKSDNETYEADSVVIATGAKPRTFGIESEEKYLNKGVSYCATCDGFFFKGKAVAVLGGGDTAVEEALYLTNFCKKVYLIHRRDALRAEKIQQQKLFDNDKIEIVWDSLVQEFVGDGEKLSAVRVKNKNTEEVSDVEVDGAFVAIGYVPNSQIFQGSLDIDELGYIKVKEYSTETREV
ncbi:MAG: thioredoxin-disulfide reductase, partial [Alphaproteobacteria bacterium]|nr:thioredoxin-disulfide reductase [Alphaproteobacteria bacterium]